MKRDMKREVDRLYAVCAARVRRDNAAAKDYAGGPQHCREAFDRLERENNGVADKHGVFHSWRNLVPPHYFFRGAARRGWSVTVYERYAFARQITDFQRRGEIELDWPPGEKKHTVQSLWTGKLTQKGRENLKKYANKVPRRAK